MNAYDLVWIADADVGMTDAHPARRERFPRNLYYADRAAASARAKETDGEPSSTMCFHRVHLDHPHHHLLRCGHDILTNSIEQCGSNCQLSDRAESKPSGKAFECLHPKCVQERRTFRQKSKTVGRRGKLSHVYGRDLDADAARQQEKAKYAAMPRVALSEKVFKTKRSPSPEPAARRFPEMRTKTALRKAQSEAYVKKTITEVNLNRNLEKFDALGFEKQEKPQEPIKPFEEPEAVPNEIEEHLCDCCDVLIEDIRYRCYNCEGEHGLEVDVCAQCFKLRNVKHWSHKPSYHENGHSFTRIVVSQPREDDRLSGMRRGPDDHDKDFEMLHTYCVCEVETVENMLECEKCEKPFHLGCVGEGLHAEIEYQVEGIDRFHEEDMNAWKQKATRTPFMCIKCKFGGEAGAGDEEARDQMENDLRKLRRQRMQELKALGGRHDSKTTKRKAREMSSPIPEKPADAYGEAARMSELFGEEERQVSGEKRLLERFGAPIEQQSEERTAKRTKTGHEVPSYGHFMTLPMRSGSRK